MKIILEQLLNGLTIGSFYALIALGYSMVYGVMKLINFAHGDLFALGSYLGYTLLVFGSTYVTATLGIWGGMIAAILIAAIGIGIAGYFNRANCLSSNIFSRPTSRSSVCIRCFNYYQNGIMVVWGPRPQAYPSLGCSFGYVKYWRN